MQHLITATITIITFIAITLAAFYAASSPAPPSPTPQASTPAWARHQIHPGETLWAIARAASCPRTDTRETVYNIMQANPGLDPGRLQVGQVIKVPATPGYLAAYTVIGIPEEP